MEFSEYDGPFTEELQDAWNSLSEDQQYAIQSNADAAQEAYFIATLFGDQDTALSIAEDVVREAHRIAELPLPLPE